jgi:hypothetical protein
MAARGYVIEPLGKCHTKNTIGIRGHWIHIELHRLFADNPAHLEMNWRKIPKPVKNS